MANPHTVVILGATPDSYYVGHGRRYFVENMSESFTNHAKSELNVANNQWISVNRTTEIWVEYNMATGGYRFNADMSTVAPDIYAHLTATNDKFGAQFLTFPDSADPTHFFARGRSSAQWTALLPHAHIAQIKALQVAMPDFEDALTGMLFGQGETSIVLFNNGFEAHFDEKYVNEEDHPLYKVLVEFSAPGAGWCIQLGSSLCFYDSKYYLLKFKKPGDSMVHSRWNLPLHVAAKLQELKDMAPEPEEQIALQHEAQMSMTMAMGRMNQEMQATQAMASMMTRGAMGINAIVSGGTVVETTRYY
ncbi:hypothetical protein C8R43DRAFT_1043404 [Mycena crocata]|nr:hypothetical protein C8R43DRAFT_1043404 [Mycena crocata]